MKRSTEAVLCWFVCIKVLKLIDLSSGTVCFSGNIHVGTFSF